MTKNIRVFIQTFGCQMNVRDSEVIAGMLCAHGWEIADSAEGADVVILNTCSVRQNAEDRVWSIVGQIAKRAMRKSKNKPIIGLVGCMAQNYKEQAFSRAPAVDFVVGPSDIAKIPDIIKSFFTDDGRRRTDDLFFERKVWEAGEHTRPEEIYHTGFYQDKKHAYVVISEGCSNFCSYCVVPYVRGAPRHRRHQGIIKEIEKAIEKGITDFTLLGQNVNAYCDQKFDFIELIKKIDQLSGVKEFGFLTSHPRDTEIGLFCAIADCKKLQKCLHLPIQSGSDRILDLMGRGYTRKYYLDLAQKYRKIVVGGKLTTDIIVGFPTESGEDFQDTYDLVKDAAFDAAYIFKYSPRPGTKAAGMSDDVARVDKEKRHKLILDLQRKTSKKKKCHA